MLRGFPELRKFDPKWKFSPFEQRLASAPAGCRPPKYTVHSPWPIRPMSWNRGSQLTPTSSGPNSRPAGPPIASTLAEMLAWVSTTPFGCDVEPEVNWSSAGASRSIGSDFGRGGPVSSVHDATNRSVEADACNLSSSGSSRGVVTTARARARRKSGTTVSKYASSWVAS